MMTFSCPVGAGPASPSTVTTAPSGHTSTTIPVWTEVAVLWGPVPYSTASPGAGRTLCREDPAVGGGPRVDVAGERAWRAPGSRRCAHTHVTKRAHHASQGPYGLQYAPLGCWQSGPTWLVASGRDRRRLPSEYGDGAENE